MKRNFENFLSGYLEYTLSDYVPEKYHLWAGVSAIATSLERKVWGPRYKPNLYIMLVGGPSVGKTTAIRYQLDLLKQVSVGGRGIKFLPSKVTDAGLYDILEQCQTTFNIGSKNYPMTPVFYHAKEASADFKDIDQGFFEFFTSVYDSDASYEKYTKRSGSQVITAPCMNAIVACTFDYLNKLISNENIMGGFASRFTYVVHDSVIKRNIDWGEEAIDDVSNAPQAKKQLRLKLIEDLNTIFSLKGRFKATPDFQAAYSEWATKVDEEVQNLENEKVGALLSRKIILCGKLSMIMSAATSNDLILTLENFNDARAMAEDATSNISEMLIKSKINSEDTNKVSPYIALEYIRKKGPQPWQSVVAHLTMKGVPPNLAIQQLEALQKGGNLIYQGGTLQLTTKSYDQV